MDHSDLDRANFEAICTKTPPYSSLGHLISLMVGPKEKNYA